MHELANLAAWADGNVEPIAFYLLMALAIPLAYGVIFDRTIIRAGFLLIGVFGAISGLFLLLEAQFLAMAQVMIYAVGITLVVVIALMLTNPRMDVEESTALPIHVGPAALTAVLMFLIIHLAVRSQPWVLSGAPMLQPNVQVLGLSLMTFYSLPFELASVLLLAALIGAVMLAKAEPPGGDDSDDSAPVKSSERVDDVVKV